MPGVLLSGGSGTPELANFLTLVEEAAHENAVVEFLHHFEPLFFSILVLTLFAVFVLVATRRWEVVPGRLQAAVELPFVALHDLVTGVMGPRGSRYSPFIATVFLYILTMNLIGLVPGMMSPTANLGVTGGMAVCVFFYVQWTGIRTNGILGYLHHLCGSPEDAVGWGMVPLMLPLHILEELIKPMSLALRLFGNVLGEDALIAQFAILGIMVVTFISPHIPVGIPLQTPIMFLALLTGTIQALVFAMLATMYIFLMLPHEEHS